MTTIQDAQSALIQALRQRITTATPEQMDNAQLLLHVALLKGYGTAAEFDAFSPEALSLLSGVNVAELNSYLTTLSGRQAFEKILDSNQAVRAISNDAAILQTIAASTTAMSALMTNLPALDVMLASGLARQTLFASNVAVGALIANPSAYQRVLGSLSAFYALLESQTGLNVIFANSESRAAFKNALTPPVVSMPIMTGTDTPSGIAIGSTFLGSGYEYFKAYDGSANTAWATPFSQDQWLGYQFPEPVFIHTVTLPANASSPDRLPRQCRVDCSKDGMVWQVATPVFTTGKTTTNMIDVAMAGRYRYWRLYALNNHGDSGYTSVATMSFSGFR